MALKDFFAGFPEFAVNDFYVTGESYAGVYVPMLSCHERFRIQLQGNKLVLM